MNLYAESSAVLSWIFREEPASRLKEILDGADLVVASDLTLVECERALVRARAMGELSDHEALQRKRLFAAVTAGWMVLRLDREVLERAGRRFPAEPLRTLDALHVASALAAQSAISDLALLSLDRRVRENGVALGFDVLPA
ncbi:MAG TPA: type II toxin-antitoxin system VapC family toxin [Thermoanaerobaculia bacterium]|jgi:predicted nucleic acid-binding protein